MKNKPFKITFQEDWFERGDIISGAKTKMKIVSTPKMHLWQRIRKFFGFNYEWYYKVKEL